MGRELLTLKRDVTEHKRKLKESIVELIKKGDLNSIREAAKLIRILQGLMAGDININTLSASSSIDYAYFSKRFREYLNSALIPSLRGLGAFVYNEDMHPQSVKHRLIAAYKEGYITSEELLIMGYRIE